MLRRRTKPLVLALALLGAAMAARPGIAGQAPQEDPPPVLAVIVNPKNPTTNLTFNQLRSYMKLEHQFWPNKKRCVLLLRPSSSPEMQILLKKVYRTSPDQLRKYWVGKVFRGEISSKPGVVPTAKAAGTRVRKIPAALTVVLANETPEGVRVLTIDGKKPGDPGYPLVGVAAMVSPQ